MPAKNQVRQHDLPHVPILSDEEKILEEKMAELQNTIEEQQETLHNMRAEHYVGLKAKKYVEKAKKTKHEPDIRFAMGYIEGCIEILKRPLMPEED